MGIYDHATRAVLEASPDGLLALALGPGLRAVRPLEGQRATVLRLRDGLFRAVRDGRPVHPHIERAIDLLLRSRLARSRRVALAVAAAIFGERAFSDRSWRDILDEEVVMGSALVDAWRAEGRADGQISAAQDMLLRFIRGKLRRLPRGLRAAVADVQDLKVLGNLAEEIAGARDAAAVRAALARALGPR